jgi:hypothetical protein
LQDWNNSFRRSSDDVPTNSGKAKAFARDVAWLSLRSLCSALSERAKIDFHQLNKETGNRIR